MDKTLRPILGILLLMVFSLTLGCTRPTGDAKGFSLTIPTDMKSTLSTSMIGFAVVNINFTDGTPKLVLQQDFHNNPLPVGTPITFEVKNAPAGAIGKVQALVVMQNITGLEEFAYGSAAPEAVGDTEITVDTTIIGSATKSAEVSGRFLTGTGPDTGPTGAVQISFQPPNADPPMVVHETEIYNGWFSDFFVPGGGVQLTYKMLNSGSILFQNLDLSHPALSTLSAYLLKVPVTQPTYISHGGGEMEPRPPTDHYVGYFKPQASSITLSGRKVCYLNSDETVPNVSLNPSMTNQLVWKGSGSGVSPEAIPQGGNNSTYNDFLPGGTCDTVTGSSIQFYHNHLNSFEGQSRMQGPFLVLNPWMQHGGALIADWSSGSINLRWKYLPGVLSNAVDGATLFSLYDPSNQDQGGGYDEVSCNEMALQRGYVPTTDSAGQAFNFTGNSQASLTSSNAWDFRFILCPYKLVSGVKKYFKRGAEAYGLQGSGPTEHMGWGIDSVTVTNVLFDSAGFGGSYTKVSGISLSSPDISSLTISSPIGAGINPGDEIMVLVTGHGTYTACGGDGLDNIGAGMMHFSRVIETDSSSYLKIPSGSWVDHLDSAALSNSAISGTGFCSVQAVRVPHFKNLSITGVLSSSSFDYGSGMGGVVAFRVGGTLSLASGAQIKVDNAGFAGGDGSLKFGAGLSGDKDPSISSYSGGSGGMATFSLSGGGGAGAGGNGGDGSNPQLSQFASGGSFSGGGGGGPLPPLHFGSGGGGTDEGAMGGNGGGVIMVMARHLDFSSSVVFSAMGGDGAGAITTSGGGGGGGTIYIGASKSVAHANPAPLFEVNGGTVTSYDAGGGGGGRVTFSTCNNYSGGSLTLNATSGSGLGNGDAGSSGATTVDPDPHRQFCLNSP